MARICVLYDPTKDIDAREVVEYSEDIYYHYGDEVDGKYPVIAIVHVLSNGSWVIDAEQSVLNKLRVSIPYDEEPHPLFCITVIAYGRYAKAIAPYPTGDKYFGHRIINCEPSKRTWESIRDVEFQISPAVHELEDLSLGGKK